MSKIILDTLDDRREIWRLLSKLPPRRRANFWLWCCDQVSTRGRKPRPNPLTTPDLIRQSFRSDEGDARLTSEIYLDLWLLVSNYQLDQRVMSKELERRAKAIR